MKSPLIISVSALALLTLSATLFAQTTTGSSLISQMKAAVHDFTLATDLNPGVTDLKSGPVSGKKTGDMLTAEEYNRLLELVGQGGGGGSDGGFTTTLFDDITDGLANGGVKTYTCPQNQYVLSVTSIMVPSGQYSCANSPNADKKSVSYNSCAALTGQRWHTHVICGGGGAGDGTPTGNIYPTGMTAGNCEHGWGGENAYGTPIWPAKRGRPGMPNGCTCEAGWTIVRTGTCDFGNCALRRIPSSGAIDQIYFYQCIKD